MAHHAHETKVTVLPPNKEKIKQLWTVAGIMAFITAIEFVIAFVMDAGTVKTSIFVILTIFKAGYIVGEFMHLRYETKLLFWSILVPIVFIIWAIVVFIYEGMAIGPVRI
jgi:cytochrome c oxidase subunit IV